LYRADERWDVQCFVYIITIPRTCQNCIRASLLDTRCKMTKQQLDYFRPYINNKDRISNWAKPKSHSTNRHHPACRSRVEKESQNHTIELFELIIHRPFHQVFGNGLFQENLEQLIRIQWWVLSDKYKKDLLEVINMQDNYVYKDGLYIKR